MTVTATVGEAEADSVVIHVINATAPPAAAIDASKTGSLGGPATVTPPAVGKTVVTIGEQGVTSPSFSILPFFDAAKWVFRVNSISHSYKLSINSQGKINLTTGNPTPFPQASGLDLVQSHQRARDDFDTTGRVPTGTSPTGPFRMSYWVDFISQNHEQAHVARANAS